VLRKYQGSFTDYYDYVTNLLRLCYDIAGSDTVKLRLHYIFRPRTTYGYATDTLRLRPAIYGYLRFLRSLAVNYGRNGIFEHVENRATEKQDDGSVTVDPGTTRSFLRTRDGYPTDNPGGGAVVQRVRRLGLQSTGPEFKSCSR